MKSTALCCCSLSDHSGTLGAGLQISSFCCVACDKTTKRRVRYGSRRIRQFFWFAIDRCVAAVALVAVEDKLPLTDTGSDARPARTPSHTSCNLGVTLRACRCVTRQKRRTPSCLKALLGVSRALGREMLLVALSAANMYTMLRTSVHTDYCTDTQPWVL